jgi:hypothetical protein
MRMDWTRSPRLLEISRPTIPRANAMSVATATTVQSTDAAGGTLSTNQVYGRRSVLLKARAADGTYPPEGRPGRTCRCSPNGEERALVLLRPTPRS